MSHNVVECYELPEQPEPSTVYRLLPRNPDDAYYALRTNRNIGWIMPHEQDILRNSTIGIAGCGGMGAILAERFVRVGVGEIRITDCETFDATNINRQIGATRWSIGKSKAFETAKLLRGITDDFTLVVDPRGIEERSVHSFIAGCDVLCDEIEFWATGARVLFHREARAAGVSIFCAPTVGFGTRTFFFGPETGTMEELIGLSYEEAVAFQEKVRTKTLEAGERLRVMEQLLAGFAPELPEYCAPESGVSNIEYLKRRLREDGSVSIFPTNPIFAAGKLADDVAMYLLRNSGVKRNIVAPEPAPGCHLMDAELMQAKILKPKDGKL